MNTATLRSASTLAALLLAVGLTACGSGSGSSTSSADQFRVKGGDNSIQETGEEAGRTEREEAAAVLHEYLDARAAGAWGEACRSLAPTVVAQLARLVAGAEGGTEPSCAAALAGLSADVPRSLLRQAATADVGAFRVDGDSGVLLFHDAQDVDYFVPMARIDGEWKVAALAPSALQ